MTSTASSEQFSTDPFWKSPSMDTINQILSGNMGSDIGKSENAAPPPAITPVGASNPPTATSAPQLPASTHTGPPFSTATSREAFSNPTSPISTSLPTTPAPASSSSGFSSPAAITPSSSFAGNPSTPPSSFTSNTVNPAAIFAPPAPITPSSSFSNLLPPPSPFSSTPLTAFPNSNHSSSSVSAGQIAAFTSQASQFAGQITPISQSSTQIVEMQPVTNGASSSSVTSMLATFQSSQLAIATPSNSRDVVRVEKEPIYVDVTPYLILPQHEAARRLGVPCSTLSKRWKEASLNRKWPFRIVCKLDKEITTLLKNVENTSQSSSNLSPVVEENLGLLLKKRQEELRTVVIRIN